MNEELAKRHAEALQETLGFEGRMISNSKSSYARAYPDRMPVFNANVCLAAGKIWHGDLDLSLDEPLLGDLAEKIDEIVYVLYESDGRFEHEQLQRLDKAVFSVTPSGHTAFQSAYIERTADGTLRRRPLPPPPRHRWRWRVLRHRPRLLRFWVVERKSRTFETTLGRGRRTLLYIGKRDSRATPLLVLGLDRGKGRVLSFELTWYPARPYGRRAPRELIKLTPSVALGRLQLWLHAVVWPGSNYQLQAGWQIKRRSW